MKEKREKLTNRFLCKGMIKIEECDYEFLFNFQTYKEAIENNPDKELFFVDNGRSYNTSWCIYYYVNNCGYPVSKTLHNSEVKDMIFKIYPLTDEEISERIKNEAAKKAKQKEYKSKEYKAEDKATGKYKDKTWIEVKAEDPSYIKWMLNTTKNMNMKKMLLTL